MLQADKLVERLRIWIRNNSVPFFATLLTGFAAHGFAMTNKLVNHDEVGGLFIKGATVDSGRWGLELTPLLFPDYSMPWIYGIISLLLVAVAVCLLTDLFGIRSKLLQALLGGLVVTYPALTGTFTYMFTATSYMLAFLLAVAGPYLFCRNDRWSSRLLAAACITVSVGIYQSYIAVAASLLVLYLFRQLLEGELSVKQVFARGIASVLLLAVSLGLYWLINQLAVLLTGMEAGVYATSAESAHGIVWRIVQAYGAFALSFVTGMNGLIPTVFGSVLHLLCMAAVLLLLILQLRKKSVGEALALLGLLCLLPLAMNCMYLIAGSGAIHTLVLYSNACIYVLAAVILQKQEGGRVFYAGAAVCMALVIAGNLYTANRAYLNLHLRYENNYATCSSLLTQMQLTPGYTKHTPVLLAGYLDEPEVSAYFRDLEAVAGVHGVSVNSWSSRMFFAYYCGAQLPEPEEEQTQRIYESAEFAAMPCWPDHGSVAMIEDVLVVKFSEE